MGTSIKINGKALIIKGADFSQYALGKNAYMGQYNILAPVGWSPNDEPVNIVKKFRDSTIDKKRYIFTISDEATSIPNGVYYLNSPTRLYETINGVEVESQWNRGTAIVPTAGSTNRYIIVSGDKYGLGYAMLKDALWAHLDSSVTAISADNNGQTIGLTRLTQDEGTLVEVDKAFYPSGGGIIYFPATLTTLGYGFRTANLSAVVCYATTPPSENVTTSAFVIDKNIYVPDASVNAYKASPRWSAYSSYIKPLSEFNPNDYITP